MTPFYSSLPANIIYQVYNFNVYEKEETLSLDELEKLNVLDVNRYKKENLLQMIGNFL